MALRSLGTSDGSRRPAPSVIPGRRADRGADHCALSVIFLGLAVDEYASIHETLIEPFRGDQGFLYFGWVIPGAAFVAATAAFFARFALPTMQEAMEMAGMIVFNHTLLRHLGERSPR